EVTALQTHVSALFFAGDLVYKVKKPVDLGFLDFSTPAARKRACEEEVRLNAELAPGVYRRVATIGAAGGGRAGGVWAGSAGEAPGGGGGRGGGGGGGGGGVRIAREGEALSEADVIEFAVEMVRLPADRMLDRVLEEGTLDDAALVGIVDRLATFHAAAPAG